MRLTRRQEAVVKARVNSEIPESMIGQIKTIDAAGVITVTIDGYGDFPIPNASGQTLSVGDVVTIRTYGKSINTAEIAAIAARESSTSEAKVFWR